MASSIEDDEPSVALRPAAHAARDGYDVGRLLAFSDGVFAIAITLLVLGIPVPRVAPNDSAQLVAALVGLRGNLLGFALSFLLVGAQWIAHHRMLRNLATCDQRLLWLNLLPLMGICLVPFASSVLIEYGGRPPGAITYAALQGAIGVTFVALRTDLVKRGALPHTSLLVSLIPVLGFALSIPVALRNVNAAYALWVVGFGISRVIEARTRTSARGDER